MSLTSLGELCRKCGAPARDIASSLDSDRDIPSIRDIISGPADHSPLVLCLCFLGKTSISRHDEDPARAVRQRPTQRRVSPLVHIALGLQIATLLDWLHPAAGRLARLQKVHVVTEDPGLAVPDLFQSAAALREVILTDQNFSFSPSLSIIPWAQMTHYHGKYDMNRQMAILEAAAPSLVEAAIGVTLSSSAPYRQVIITAPRLRRLCLWNTDFVDHLIAPSLDTLSSLRSQNSGQILSFIQRSSCRLTKLVLMSHRYTPNLVALFKLEALPVLTCLFIASPARIHYIPLFQALSKSSACPSLTSFLYGYNPMAGGEDWDKTGRLFSQSHTCASTVLALYNVSASLMWPNHPPLCMRTSRLN
ncbi:hypothetical protein C8R47DRAFT_1319378 [Mycena vitilis]|nr:hypothetical protein C8R47DRAFT_1319378 [Mycena vitilis]